MSISYLRRRVVSWTLSFKLSWHFTNLWPTDSFWALPKILHHRKWPLHLKAPVVPSRSGHFGHFVSRHVNCAQRETFQAPSDLAWNSSDCFESFPPLKIKFPYIFYKHHLNFETKMRFLCKELKFGLLKKLFSLLCECVSCSYDATSAKSPPF